MKRIFILLAIVSIACSANAALQISVNGDKDPANSEYTIAPSQNLILDIWTNTTISPGVGEGTFALVCLTQNGTISGGENVSDEPSLYIYSFDSYEGHTGIWASVTLGTAPSLAANSTLVDNIDFHCEWQPNDVLIELLYDPVYPVYGVSEVVDSVIIHQAPEPITMSLLGLGGLLLRKRK
ncbi:MAG: PEP-CTERM sorting domain-containing protein [Sedimentisphaerales bacterium]|nr:PEP-CTERM sorting domain-containing protein [Sedimentisphaerales bacterium]